MQTLVADLCSRDILSTAPETSAREALSLLAQSGKSSLLVMLQGEAIGIITERDCVRSAPKIVSFPDLLVSDIMSSPLLTVDETVAAYAAFRNMQQQQIRHLAVRDAHYDICGLLSLTDLLYKYAPACIPATSTVAELMATPVVTVPPTSTVQQVLAEMAQHPISCVVVSDGKRAIGMLTERDVPRILSGHLVALQQPVTATMTSPHPAIPPATSTLEAIALMQQRGIRRLIVSEPDGRIAGLVTQSRLGRAIAL